MLKKTWPHRIIGWIMNGIGIAQFVWNMVNDTVWVGVLLLIILFAIEFCIDRFVFKWRFFDGYYDKS